MYLWRALIIKLDYVERGNQNARPFDNNNSMPGITIKCFKLRQENKEGYFGILYIVKRGEKGD